MDVWRVVLGLALQKSFVVRVRSWLGQDPSTAGLFWARLRHLPRNLACPSNAAISIVRLNCAFRYLPEANRHYAARPQDALDAILTVTKS